MKMPKSFKAKALTASAVVLVAGGTLLGLTLNNPQSVEKDSVKLTTSVGEPKEEVQSAATEVVEQTPAAQPVPQTQQEPAPQTQTTNPFQTGFSGYHVFNRRTEIGKPLPESANGQYSSKVYCEGLAGQAVSSPVKHGFACIQKGQGHMVFIEEVNADGSFWVSEMGSRGQVSMTDTTPAGGFGKVDYKLIPADQTNFYTLYFN